MEIRIGKPGRVCAGTSRPFDHGEKVVSVVKIEDREIVRRDFAQSAWEPEQGVGAMAVWETQYVDPKVAEQEPEEVFSPLRKLFYEAFESAERMQLARAYLAAQLLRRQKVFRLIKESDDDDGFTRVALFNDRIGNRLVEVRDPQLTYSELEAARMNIMEVLAETERPPETAAESTTNAPRGKDGEQ
jgi:hypothetical protein